MKHTTLWQTESAFNNVSNGLAKPHVSLVRENNHVYFIQSEAGPTLEMVDLGLSVLWAKCNLGAQSETEYGDYYQWAATTPLSVSGTTVDWHLCPYTTDGETFEKYTGSDYPTLQTEDDAVASQFTGYRMPTRGNFQELLNQTNHSWVKDFNGSGVNGHKFTSKSDSSKYIFLPATGTCYDSELILLGQGGGYWSSSIDASNPIHAVRLYVGSEFYNIDDGSRAHQGLSIRPVSQ